MEDELLIDETDEGGEAAVSVSVVFEVAELPVGEDGEGNKAAV